MNTPLCILCNTLMYLDSVGHYMVIYSDEEMKSVHVGDLYKCPACGYEIITDWGPVSVDSIKSVDDAISLIDEEYLHLVKTW